jgi:hypothetical protein
MEGGGGKAPHFSARVAGMQKAKLGYMIFSVMPQHPTHRTQPSMEGLLLDSSIFPSISGNLSASPPDHNSRSSGYYRRKTSVDYMLR